MEHYSMYYNADQVGGGKISEYNRFGRVYVGAPYQRGHGIGAFLGGLFRRALPFITSGVRTIGKEALRAGINILSDGSRGVPLKEAAENRLTEAGLNLKRKARDKIANLMQGSGYKVPVKRTRGIQSLRVRPSMRVSPVIQNNKKTNRRRKKKAAKRKKATRRRHITTTKDKKKKKTTKKKKKRNTKKNKSTRSVRDIFGPA